MPAEAGSRGPGEGPRGGLRPGGLFVFWCAPPAAPGPTRSCDARRGRLADARERTERRASAGWSLRFESAISPTTRLVVRNRAYDKPNEVILIYTDERSGPMGGMEFTHGRTIVARLTHGADLLA